MKALWLAAMLSLLACGGGSSGTGGGAGGSAGGGAGGSGGGSAGGGTGGTGGGGGTGGSTGGGTGGTGGSAGGGTGGGSTTGCMAGDFLASLGKSRLLVGGRMQDAEFAKAAFDVRYEYLSAGFSDGEGPCASCAMSCAAGGKSCANSAGGCAWWGCYQYDQDPPGAYVRDFVGNAKKKNALFMVTYYEFLQASGAQEGPNQWLKAADLTFMKKYFNDWRFVLQQIGQEKAFLYVEPDLWGYAQQFNADPHKIPAKVATANVLDCAGKEESAAGFGQCLVAMVRKYAPNAKVGLHASSWASGKDVNSNKDPGVSPTAEAAKTAAYLKECGGAAADFVGVEALDRDAGYYLKVRGQDVFWDVNNVKLPHFTQHFTWAKAIAEGVGKPLVWWQLPLGNPTLNDTADHYKDNRVDYFFAHPEELAKAHGTMMLFGEGAADQTDPATDSNYFINKAKAYLAGPGQKPCP